MGTIIKFEKDSNFKFFTAIEYVQFVGDAHSCKKAMEFCIILQNAADAQMQLWTQYLSANLNVNRLLNIVEVQSFQFLVPQAHRTSLILIKSWYSGVSHATYIYMYYMPYNICHWNIRRFET